MFIRNTSLSLWDENIVPINSQTVFTIILDFLQSNHRTSFGLKEPVKGKVIITNKTDQ